jgi:branched-chain amino acid transport system ATP-binding protein
MLLSVNNLHVHYGRIAAVRGVSLEVDEGEFVCLVGPNGAGKSTIMLAIAGGLVPSEGSITLENKPIAGAPAEQIARLGVSLVPSGRHVFSGLTVEENLRLGTMMRRDRATARRDLADTLNHFPILRERLKAPAGKLSGGEQQQLVIARALLTKPKILLLDEPSLGLAPALIDRVYEILAFLREQGTTILVVEESATRALGIAHRIYVMNTGIITLAGAGRDLQDTAEFRLAYFGFADE